MKLSEIKPSRNFSIVILIIVASIFLLPVFSMNFMFWLADKKEQLFEQSLDDTIALQVKTVQYSIKQLGIVDAALLQCVKEQANELAKLPPTSSGSIKNIEELEWLNCPDSQIVNLEGLGRLQNLVALGLANNRITNIKELTKLVNLEEANLSHNAIVSFDALSVLPKLKKINLSGNHPDSLKSLLDINSLQEVDMPNTSKIYCVDVEFFLKSATFAVRKNSRSEVCKGKYSSNIERIVALKKADGELSPEDESVLLEYELNQMKAAYKQKYH